MKDEGDLTRILKRTAIWVGILILAISIYLSFDGFDGKVSGSNSEYSAMGVAIGVVFAVAVTILQFIFTSAYKSLNATLKVIGLLSYAYSIYTNMLGAQNILGMDDLMAWTTAIFADIVAEPMIAWGLGEAMVGDLLGNIGKAVYGKNESRSGRFQESFREESDQVGQQGLPGFRPTPKPTFQSMKKSNKPKYHFPFK